MQHNSTNEITIIIQETTFQKRRQLLSSKHRLSPMHLDSEYQPRLRRSLPSYESSLVWTQHLLGIDF